MEGAEHPSIAIIGGGLAGLTLSIGLTRHGISHKIYESASKFAEIGAGIALGPNSLTALELIDSRIKDGLKTCITYNEGIDEEGRGKGSEEFMGVRVGEEAGYVSQLGASFPFTSFHTSQRFGLKPVLSSDN